MSKALVLKYLELLQEGQMFATRDILHLGIRPTIDVITHRLVKSEVITRLANGLFMKGDGKDETTMPTAEEIARAKGRAFDRDVSPIDQNMADKMRLDVRSKGRRFFATNGRSTSFWSSRGRIHLLGMAPRKITLRDSRVGTQLRTLWRAGDRFVEPKHIDAIKESWSPSNLDECSARIKQLPQWLSSRLYLPDFRPGAERFRLRFG